MKLSIATLFATTLSSYHAVSALDIVSKAMDLGGFDKLVLALDAAELKSTLMTDPGPFTVFAPTDDAFLMSLPVGYFEFLKEPDQKEKLQKLLKYHVLDNVLVDSSTAMTLVGQNKTTLNGETIDISLDGADLKINDAKLIVKDVTADNGIIHALDSVLIPPSFGELPKDLKATAVEAGTFETLLAAIEAANLTETVLKSPGPWTIFAPDDDAFAALPEGTIDALLADVDKLKDVLKYHVIDGRKKAADLFPLEEIPTVQGSKIDIFVDQMDWSIKLNNSTKVIASDIVSSNGVIHVIDSVLMPMMDDDDDNMMMTPTPAPSNMPSM